MLVYQEPRLSTPEECSYLPGRDSQMTFFFASDLSEEELDLVLRNSWRKFGAYFFRPQCQNCSACIPVRVPVIDFVASKSQRRNLKRNSDIVVQFISDWNIDDELYELYENHSINRFGKKTDYDDFRTSFGFKSCPSYLSKYYLENKLIAAGFIDKSTDGLSSVYFIYHNSFLVRGLGNFSILKEIEFAKKLQLKFYYLGYFVDGNAKMHYKSCFFPHERMNWCTGIWERVSES
jgi:arginine-tRNA-protein transferase